MNDAHATLEPLLSAYLDGELDASRRHLVAAHVATCAICAQELAQLRAGDEALASLQPTPAAPDLRAQLRRRLRRQGAPKAVAGGFIAIIFLLLRALPHELAIVKRKDLPLWGRMGIASSRMLMLTPGIALCVELLRDVRTLAEYAWVSGEASDTGERE